LTERDPAIVRRQATGGQDAQPASLQTVSQRSEEPRILETSAAEDNRVEALVVSDASRESRRAVRDALVKARRELGQIVSTGSALAKSDQ
jgi:hypothetical protein